jgi:hypothetical protein
LGASGLNDHRISNSDLDYRRTSPHGNSEEFARLNERDSLSESEDEANILVVPVFSGQF